MVMPSQTSLHQSRPVSEERDTPHEGIYEYDAWYNE